MRTSNRPLTGRLADSFARLHFVPPGVICAPPTGPYGPFGGLVSLRLGSGLRLTRASDGRYRAALHFSTL